MTTITIDRAVVEQALEAMRCAVPTGKITLADWHKSIAELEAVLAQQVKHVAWANIDSDRLRVDPATGNVSIGAQQAEPVEGPEAVDQRVGPLVESALQAVAEKIGDQCAVWYGIGARDVEEVLREAARYGLVHGTLAEPVSADAAYQRWLADTHAPALRRMDSQGAFAAGWQAALAQQAEPVEPVAWVRLEAWKSGKDWPDDCFTALPAEGLTPLCKCADTPPQRLPLTDEEIRDLWSWSMTAEAERTATTQQHAFTRAVERAHGITDPQVADRLARHGILMPEGDPK